MSALTSASNTTPTQAGRNSFSFPSISFDNSLVEISALTTLIGTGAAASLVLGTRGAAGLAWAATSSFGIVGVIKACVSGACPGWLRETLGVRTEASNLAVGMDLDLTGNSHGPRRVRKNLDRPLAIICDSRFSVALDTVPDTTEKDNTGIFRARRARSRLWNDVYVLDHSLSATISGVPDTNAGDPLRIFSYAQYDFRRKHDVPFQASMIALSLLKITESYALWKYGSGLLALLSASPWCYFFIVACIVEAREFKLSRSPENSPGQSDVIAGKFPTFGQPGGGRKVILGVARNSRTSWWWAVMWAVGAVVCAVCLFMTYILLGKQPKDNIFIWAGFQSIWMVVRLLIYHFSELEDPLANRRLTALPLDRLSSQMKWRVLEMIMASSKYQTFIHPRGEIAYKTDLSSSAEIRSFLAGDLIRDYYPILQGGSVPKIQQVDVKAVIGDTTLSSAAWVVGSKLAPMDVYDSCIVIFSQPRPRNRSSISSPKTMAISSVRVLAGRTVGPISIPDPEKSASAQFVPQGSSNAGFGISWRYWVPCEPGLWLYITTDEDRLDVTGKQKAEVLTDAQVTAMLAAGTMNISFAHVDDIREALKVSRQAKESLLKILS